MKFIKKEALVLGVLILAIAGVMLSSFSPPGLTNIPPAPSLPTMTDNLVTGEVVLYGEVLHGEFAEPYDTPGLYSSEGLFDYNENPEPYFLTIVESFNTLDETQPAFDVKPYVYAPNDGVIHKRGYYLRKDGLWVPFEYQPDARPETRGQWVSEGDEEPIWIQTGAEASIPIDPETASGIFSEGENYVLAYVCLKGEEEQWKCGCKVDNPENCGYWMVQSFSLCIPGKGFNEYGQCIDVCGNAITTGPEVCDDNNRVDGDGCTFQCDTVEDGWQCPSLGGVCTSICGDSLCRGDELTSCPTDCVVCGNGRVDSGEECDDGDTEAGDGCSASCEREDDDQDGVLNQHDLCPGTLAGTAVDSVGCSDAQVDGDDDGICNPGAASIGPGECTGNDNCLTTPNPGQEDIDRDMMGDACDPPECDNKVVEDGEQCDLGTTTSLEPGVTTSLNGLDGTGCGDLCAAAPGYDCSLPLEAYVFNGVTYELCHAICGDGLAGRDQACDDGDAESGDGCSNACIIEPGWRCSGSPSTCTPICGDGLIRDGERCDDRNANNGDGCSANCLAIESGWACAGEPSVCSRTCGNGVIDSGEQCDDANAVGNDGCNFCSITPGWYCTGEPSTCETRCSDGIQAGLESCDDGNTDNSDGCSSACAIEVGTALCGNSEINTGEECDGTGTILVWQNCRWKLGPDDDSIVGTLGCTAACAFDTSACGWCGNGVREGSETCDDGNRVDGDGCSYLCQIEGCGNGVTDFGAGEQCDDGNTDAGDGCNQACQREVCGNGVIDLGEECDNGQFPAGATCASILENNAATGRLVCNSAGALGQCTISTEQCRVPGCGDGIMDAGEQCDDGDGDNYNRCTNLCTTAECGDGIVRTDTFPVGAENRRFETCDDGNTNSGDGCSASCVAELGATCTGEPSVCTATGVCGDGQVTFGEACDIGGVCDDGTVCFIGGTACSSGSCMTTAGHGCAVDCTSVEQDWVCVPYYPTILTSISVCYQDLMYNGNIPTAETAQFLTQGTCRFYSPWHGLFQVRASDDFFISNTITDRCNGWGDILEVSFVSEDPSLGLSNTCEYTSLPCPSGECGSGVCKLGEGAACTSHDECASNLYCDFTDQNNDGVTGVCTGPVCSNTITEIGRDPEEPFEECDDGNTNSEDGCSDLCVAESCGDGITQAGLGEVCDDGDTDNNDECTMNCKVPACGDGFWQTGEGCDDGNVEAGDGCSELCVREFCSDGITNNVDEECDDGNTDSSDSCFLCKNSVCGDRALWPIIMGGNEECEDGNTISGDGCNALCIREFCGDTIINNIDEECDDGNGVANDGCTGSCVREYCSDGIIQAGIGEQCDDSNVDSEDGCSSACQIEYCGDGKTQYNPGAVPPLVEQCDDSGTTAGDGCAADCATIEAGWDCIASSTDLSVCTEICGDGLVIGAEVCDDTDNSNNGIGCAANCRVVEPGWTCPTAGGIGGECTEICGDRLIVGDEECDVGDDDPGDGCSASCMLEGCYYIILEPGLETVFPYPYSFPDDPECFDAGRSGVFCNGAGSCIECGNTIVEPGEACDDGSIVPGDGCIGDCSSVETGWVCPPAGGVCTPICGDGIARGTEACDDGNVNNNDGCSASCQSEGCGDGIKQASEQCDDGAANTNNFDACLTTCLRAKCGDSYKRTDITDPSNPSYEACDDSNLRSGDGCSSNCKIEACGNGILDYLEECENTPPNTAPGDGCSPACKIEKCGDGYHDANGPDNVAGTSDDEACDDGDKDNGDGCDSMCRKEMCGNGAVQPWAYPPDTNGVIGPEQCDDGGRIAGDGCSLTCKIERCGDGTRDPDGPDNIDNNADDEQCEDGNTNNYDNCLNTCKLNVCGDGYYDPDGADNIRGNADGIRGTDDDLNLADDQQCDHNDTTRGDGCDSTCKIEMCGNRILQNWAYPPVSGIAGPETCDDGNYVRGDGCSPVCQTERCGDGFQDANGPDNVAGNADDEECDDSGIIRGDGCSPTCKIEECGDGYSDANGPDNRAGTGDDEECDDGKQCRVSGDSCITNADCIILPIENPCEQRMTDSCTNSCKNNVCGDGIRWSSLYGGTEQCDDGNGINNDKCRNDCIPARCGDSIVQEIISEQCDDGNTDDLDGCTHKCQLNSDSDVFPDDFDNCPRRTNADQLDTDSDSVGDACDNCDYVWNPGQVNSCYVPPGERFCSARPYWQRLLSKYGDVCDADYDDILDPRDSEVGETGFDNCPTVYNPEQKDDDRDGIGNACDLCGTSTTDGDGDGDQDGCDNCPNNFNSNQADGDSDGVGDVCDNCHTTYNPAQRNTGDADGLGDACDNDYCGDGYCRPNERCSSDDRACSDIEFTCSENSVCGGGTGTDSNSGGCVQGSDRPTGYTDSGCYAPSACRSGDCVDTHLIVSVLLDLEDSDGIVQHLYNIDVTARDLSDVTDPVSGNTGGSGSVSFTIHPNRRYEVFASDPSGAYGFYGREQLTPLSISNVGEDITITIYGYEN